MGKAVWIIRLIISFGISVALAISVTSEKEQVTILDLLGIPVIVLFFTPIALAGITIGQHVLMWVITSPGKDL
ncbi:hypothetical protein ACWEN6_20395 [Sphaerisporangium sp. NPDC004334]